MPDLWPFRPLLGCQEKISWLTEVLGSRTGEQRIALRTAPRQSYEYTFRLNWQQLGRARALMRQNSASTVYVPVWPEHIQYVGTISSGVTFITMDTTAGDYRIGGFVLAWQDDETYAVAEIDGISPTAISLNGTLGTTVVNPSIMPVRTGLITDGAQISRGAVLNNVAVNFLVTDNEDFSGDWLAGYYPAYGGVEVMNEKPVLLADIADSVVRAADYIDNGFGPVVAETLKNYADMGQTMVFHDERAVLKRRRTWLHNLHGRQKAFWLPTFNRDLWLQATASSGASTILVKSVASTGFYVSKNIMIMLTDGTYMLREITNATPAGGGNDTLTLASTLSTTIAIIDIEFICWLTLSRLDTDVVTIDHRYELCSVVSIPVTEIHDEGVAS